MIFQLRYKLELEALAVIAMATFMFLFGLTFLIKPSAAAFELLNNNGVQITPLGFAVLCFGAMLGYPVLLRDDVRKLSKELRQEIFMALSFPILTYLLPISYIQLRTMLTITPIYSVAFYTLVILVPLSIYHGYHRWVEIIGLVSLIAILLITGYALAFHPTASLFGRINEDFNLNLQPISLAIVCFLACIGYAFLLLRRDGLICGKRRLLFVIFELPFFLTSATTFYNSMDSGMLAIGPLAFFDLSILIGILGCALCPVEYPSK